MSDLISRQAIIDAHYDYCNEHQEAEFPVWSLELMQNLPSAQPERKKGKWIHIRAENDGNHFYECSECGHGDMHMPNIEVPYCWNCGARMES